MNTKKRIVLAAIEKVVPTEDYVEAIKFAQHNQTVYKVAFEVARMMEQNAKVTIIGNNGR